MIRLRKYVLIVSLLFMSAAVSRGESSSRERLDSLYSAFVNPPAQARPMVWWHWINGNISKEGIRKDLLWMDHVGIAGFHLFDVSRDTAVVVDRQVRYMTPEWKEAFRYAMTLADSLSMEVAVPASPGWSATGGPWVRPEDAMKKIVWRELHVKGGRRFKGALPEPYTCAGPYQDVNLYPLTDPRNVVWYDDVAVIAVRLPEKAETMRQMGAVLSSDCEGITLENMTDASLAGFVPFPKGKYIQYSFPKPRTIRSLTLVRNDKRMQFGSIPSYCQDSLQVSDDGIVWKTVMGIPMGNERSQTITFKPVTSCHFRLLSGGKRNAKISEFVLYPCARVHHAEEKAGYGSPHDLWLNPSPEAAADEVCTEVIDITSFFNDGELTWNVPKGNWVIYRFGASLTGKRNHPATPEATGLEADKLDPEALKKHFRDYLDMYASAADGLMGERGLTHLLVDSYEAGTCNYTPLLAEEFRARRGYDLHPWLPALAGVVIGSSERTDRFLWDFRTTIGELFTESLEVIPGIIREKGLKGLYMEGHENGRAYMADGMSMKKCADVPMAATWMDGGRWDRVREGRTDIKESASVADIYGKRIVAAESFTINGLIHRKAWSYHPGNLVGRANMMMSAGLNRFIIHDSAHQPVDDKQPGLGLGPYGQWFNRHETWAWKARPWMDYLSRNCVMLQEGRAVADVLYYYGEDCNVTGMFSYTDPDVPRGYNYDFVSPDALVDVLEVRDRMLVAPATGMEYRLLCLHRGQTSVMSLRVLRRLVEIARGGVPVCGPLPLRAASLSDSQEEFDALVAQLRSMPNVYEDVAAGEVLAALGIERDFDGGILDFVHRSAPAAEIYWVCNPSSERIQTQVSLRCSGRRPEIWNPLTGERTQASFRMSGDRTIVELDIYGEEARVIVLGDETSVESHQVYEDAEYEIAEFKGPWILNLGDGGGKDVVLDSLVSLSSLRDSLLRYFSGTAIYRTMVDMAAVPDSASIDLGDVADIAQVRVNGTDAGIAWKTPYRVDVSGLLKSGRNEIEVELTNRWVNRLIGEASKPTGERSVYTTMEFYKPDSPLFPSGLIGPVRLMTNPVRLEAAVFVDKMTRSGQKGDTLVYNAAAYQVMQGADSESLISKMPGISVSDNGVEAGGRDVRRILLDGQEFFGNDVFAALRTIPADMVKQIEVINMLSDNAQMTGVDDGEGYTAINVVTKKRKKDATLTGRVYGSYGLPDKLDAAGKLRHNYIAGGNLSRFSKKRTVNLIGMSNNISKFNFTSADILSGVAPLYGGKTGSFDVKALSGISSVHSLGLNYSDKKVNFSYFFNYIDNENIHGSDKFTMTSQPGRQQLLRSDGNYEASNQTHKFSGKVTLNPSKRHRIIIRPDLVFEKQRNHRDMYYLYRYVYDDADPKYLRNQLNTTLNDRWSLRASTSLSYRYSFRSKRRRTLSLYSYYSFYKNKGTTGSEQYKFNREDTDYDITGEDMYNTYLQQKDFYTGRHNSTVKLTYTEPIGRRSVFATEYTSSLSHTTGDNIVREHAAKSGLYEQSDRLSAVSTAMFLHNRVGGRYSYGFKKMNVTLSATYQHTLFQGRVTLPAVGMTDRGYNHLLYQVSVNLPFNRQHTLKLDAKGRTSNPGINLLQDVVNMSSTSNIRAGNPDLEPAYLHEAEFRYIYTGKKKGTTISLTATYTGSANYFCDSLVINTPDFEVMDGVKLGENNQYVKPVNLPGYHKFYAKTSFGMPVILDKLNFNVNAVVSLKRLPGMINDEFVPVNNNWYQLEGRFDSNLGRNIDFRVGYSARYTTNEYSGKFGKMQNNFVLHRVSGRLKWVFLGGFTFMTAAQYRQCVSTLGRYDDRTILCDVFVGRKFLKDKNLEFSVGCNDIFDDNVGIFWHTVNASGRSDGVNLGLGRYISVQLIWNILSKD